MWGLWPEVNEETKDKPNRINIRPGLSCIYYSLVLWGRNIGL